MFVLLARATTILPFGRAWENLKALGPDRRGVAAIEFALVGGFLSVALLNMVDVSIYIFQKMEVDNAAQAGAQAAWNLCGPTTGPNESSQLPATLINTSTSMPNCPGLTAAVTAAVQSTGLGTNVTLQFGSPAEGYYCLNSSNALVYVSSVSNPPANCSSVGEASLQPADYIQIQTTFTYTPLFTGITVANLLTTPITSTALIRLG
jgi:Flp pilus assembly protein TadG